MSIDKIDFAELKNDANFVSKVTNFSNSLDEIEDSIKEALKIKNYDGLSVQEKVKYDLYLSYAINSLYWMYVRIQGTDPNSHDIKHELSRVRQAMTRDKQIHERNTLRPVVDVGAAGRFIRHGLHMKRKDGEQEEDNGNNGRQDTTPKNKKIKFDD